jgi:hypothetical protein
VHVIPAIQWAVIKALEAGRRPPKITALTYFAMPAKNEKVVAEMGLDGWKRVVPIRDGMIEELKGKVEQAASMAIDTRKLALTFDALDRPFPLLAQRQKPVAVALHLMLGQNKYLDFQHHVLPALRRARDANRVPENVNDLDWGQIAEEAWAIAGAIDSRA